jgi:hypothetical protein
VLERGFPATQSLLGQGHVHQQLDVGGRQFEPRLKVRERLTIVPLDRQVVGAQRRVTFGPVGAELVSHCPQYRDT